MINVSAFTVTVLVSLGHFFIFVTIIDDTCFDEFGVFNITYTHDDNDID